MTYWNGNLLNKPKDIAIDTLLTLLLILTYIPQRFTLSISDIHQPLSSYYLAFNALHSTAEFANILLWAAYVWPNDIDPLLEAMAEGRLGGWSLMGVYQIAGLWVGDVMLIFDDPRATWLKLLVLVETILILFPAAIIALPRPKPHSWEVDFVGALLSFAIPPIMLLSIPAAFLAQVWQIQTQPGILNGSKLVPLGLQALILGALSVRSLKRLGTKPDPKHPLYGGDEKKVPLWLWYTWGMPAINLGVRAGSAAVLVGYALWQ